jgi:hypothetical protein
MNKASESGQSIVALLLFGLIVYIGLAIFLPATFGPAALLALAGM